MQVMDFLLVILLLDIISVANLVESLLVTVTIVLLISAGLLLLYLLNLHLLL